MCFLRLWIGRGSSARRAPPRAPCTTSSLLGHVFAYLLPTRAYSPRCRVGVRPDARSDSQTAHASLRVNPMRVAEASRRAAAGGGKAVPGFHYGPLAAAAAEASVCWAPRAHYRRAARAAVCLGSGRGKGRVHPKRTVPCDAPSSRVEAWA